MRAPRVANPKWWLVPVPRIYVAVLFILLCLVAGGAWKKLSDDEHSACVIQARGLPAGHDLAASMDDIGKLLGLADPKRLAALPPKQRMLYIELRDNSNAYARVEGHQPQHRSC